MRVIWLCNTLLPDISEKLSLKKWKPESWISAMYEQISKCDNIELLYLFRTAVGEYEYKEGNVQFESYVEYNPSKYHPALESVFEKKLREFQPDVIHVWGTEFPHSYSMAMAAKRVNMEDRLLIYVQGLVSVIAKHYYNGIPSYAKYFCSFRDVAKRNNIYLQKKDFERRGWYEKQCLQIAKHAVGRTSWDQANIKQINPQINYYVCEEILREVFYSGKWRYENCFPHTIFFSQCNYPVKGFHKALVVLKELKNIYPDAKLLTTGVSPFNKGIYNFLHGTYYSTYIGKLIKKMGLKDSVCFLGTLNEDEMKTQYLDSNVFLCLSSIENESNSVSEAKLLGVPTVSSYVGGMTCRIKHEIDGFFVPLDEIEMAVAYIDKLFSNPSLCDRLSSNATESMLSIVDKDKNCAALREIYNTVMGGIEL